MSRSILRVIFRRLHILLDLVQGLDFLIVRTPEELGFSPARINRASPSGNKYLSSAIQRIGVTKQDRILDIGCGKGSAMRVFCDYPFQVVGGLEISTQLSQTCVKNFLKLAKTQIEVYNCDAARFEGYGNFNFFYLYNPFPTEEILISVVDAICAQNTGDIVVLYNNPMSVEVFYERGFYFDEEFVDEWGNGMKLLRRVVCK